jgi:hypothetical protein
MAWGRATARGPIRIEQSRCHRHAAENVLAVRGGIPSSTEIGDAPGWQGARSENIGYI